MENISEHITYREATQSPTALRHDIDNTPPDHVLPFMRAVAEQCFEPVRKWYGKPLRINSFYRSPELNILVKGAANSQHVKGQAIDIDAGSREENKRLFYYIKANLIFDQLIIEYDYSWVHVSFNPGQNRNQTITVK